MVKLIDLTQEIYQGMPVYPGHLKTIIWDHHTHPDTLSAMGTGFSYETRGLLLSDHGPTHVDAINHIDPTPGAPAINEIPLEKFYTPAVCLDVSFVEPHSFVTKQVLAQACQAADLKIDEGDTVLLYTGHYTKRYGTPEWLNYYPGLDREGTQWLAEQGVVNIGIDAPSIDNPIDKTYPAHTVCRKAQLLNTENLGDLTPVIGKRFTFAGFPLKIRGGSGSPIRAVAILGD